MKSEVLKNIIESSGRQKPIPLPRICGHIVDKIIEFKVYGETSGGFGFGNESLLKICRQLIVRSEGCVEDSAIKSISTLTINSGSVSIHICDNNQIIVLDEGFNNFVIKNSSIHLRSKINGCVASTSNHFSIKRYGLWQWVRGQWTTFIYKFSKTVTKSSSETKLFGH
jgi:hypothetical protein